jgi:hypothetical protein
MYFITKNGPKFWPLSPNQSKSWEHFYGSFHRPLALLIFHWTLLSSAIQVRSLYGSYKPSKRLETVPNTLLHMELSWQYGSSVWHFESYGMEWRGNAGWQKSSGRKRLIFVDKMGEFLWTFSEWILVNFSVNSRGHFFLTHYYQASIS